jgi:uncharacterized protein
MAVSLYDATVPTFCQLLGSVSTWLDKAEAHCREKGTAPGDIIGACLAADMFPFAYQVKSTAVHSLGAIEGVRKGVFSPDMVPPPTDFGSLKACVAEALSGLKTIDPSEVNSFVGRDMRFEFRDIRLPFTAENFLLSFSTPNFFFHSTTAYDILRWKGLNVGKRDFLGQLRMKT